MGCCGELGVVGWGGSWEFEVKKGLRSSAAGILSMAQTFSKDC